MDTPELGLDYWGLTPHQQPGSYQGGEMMMMKPVFWWRKPYHIINIFSYRTISLRPSCHLAS